MAGGDYYSGMLLNSGTPGAFGLTRLEVLEAWRSHPQVALALADDLRLNGQIPAGWPRAEVIAWLKEALPATSDG